MTPSAPKPTFGRESASNSRHCVDLGVWHRRLPVAHADPPAPIPEPVLPPLAPGQVLRIGPTAGTGTPTRDYGIGATDLCEFMEFPSGILQVCGDSFAGQGVGFGGWYSPIALHVETDSIDDPTGVRYDGVTGTDKPLLADPTPPGSSQLPAGVVQINRDNYMMVTTDQGSAAAVLAVGESRSGSGQLADTAQVGSVTRDSKAAGRARSAGTTTRSRRPIRRPAGCTSWPTTSTAPARWCCTAPKRESFTDRASWQGWSSVVGPDGGWNKPPTPLWPDRVGEMSVRQIDGKTVLSYFNASNGNMEVRVADNPTALGTAPVTTVVFASEWPDPAEHLPPPRGQPAGPAVRRLHLARIHARRAARVHQPVEHPAARPGAVPRHPVRGEPVQALVNRLILAFHPHVAPSADRPGRRRRHFAVSLTKRGRVAFRGPANGYIANLDVVHPGGFREVESEWIGGSFAIALRCRCLRPRGRRADGRGRGRRSRSRIRRFRPERRR